MATTQTKKRVVTENIEADANLMFPHTWEPGTFTPMKPFKSRRNLELKSKLICEYCNTAVNLTMNNKRRNSKTATVDHSVPIIHGCDPFDESNYRVCCYKCNGEKGELSYDEWMEKKLNKV